MIAFDHRTTGTPEAEWALEPRLGAARDLGLPQPGDRVLFLAAHPDDETLGAGGLIATCAGRGVAMTVVIATDGEASHPRSPTITAARLATIRRREVQAAIAHLAPGVQVRFMGLPDGGLERHTAALAAQVEHFARGVSHVVSPWTGDQHPDHETCGRVAADVAAAHGAQHWQYPIWAWHWGDPRADDLPFDRLAAIRLDAVTRAAKADALRCHVSQHQPLSPAPGDEAILTPPMLEHFTRATEHFVAAPLAARPAHFDALYRAAGDPWGLTDRFYEQRKRALIMAALPRPRFRRAFEPGCALGLLTEQLAERCDEVLAWDVAESAVAQARSRVGRAGTVEIEQAGIPQRWPDGEFDLVVLAEVGYYCTDLDELVSRTVNGLAADGVVIGCHWRHPAAEHPHTAGAVHLAFDAKLFCLARHVEDDFILQVWSRSSRSVAAAEGIVS